MLVFAWVRATMPFVAALAAALLLLSSHLFFVLSRTGLTDSLLVLEITLAMYAFARDPRTIAARREYKAALKRHVPEPDAWATMNATLTLVRSSLDQRERNGEFNP